MASTPASRPDRPVSSTREWEWGEVLRHAGAAPHALEQAVTRLAAGEALSWGARAWLATGPCRGGTLSIVAMARSGETPGRGDGTVIETAALDACVAAAWAGPRVACAASGGAGMPWAGPAEVTAVGWPLGRERRAVLVVGCRAPADTVALAHLARAAEGAFAARAAASAARRVERQRDALAELTRTALSAAHLAEVLHLAARAAVAGCEGRVGAVWRVDACGSARLEVAHGPSGLRDRAATALGPLAAAVAHAGRVRLVERPVEEPSLQAGAASGLGPLALLPAVASGRVVGVLAMAHGSDAEDGAACIEGGDVTFLAAAADVVALAVAAAEQADALRAAGRRQQELRARLGREERDAARGDAARRAAREARHPVASIAAFARRVHRTLAADDPERESLEIVVREAERLERLLGGLLDEPPGGPRGLRVETLNASVQDALQAAAETLVRRRVRLVKRLTPDLPALLVDAERVRQVVGNLLAHALDEVPIGGRVRIESRLAGGFVQVDIAHDGPRLPGALMEDLFVPFSTGAPGPADAGPALAHRIVREHGGEIRMRSDGEWSHVVSFTLPVAANRDRRHAGERRARRSDRRRAADG
jgi:signal transduction histidine kinase